MKEFLKQLKPFRGKLAIIAILNAVNAVSLLALPYLMSKIVDEGIAFSDMESILLYSAVMLAVAILSVAALIANAKISAQVAMRVQAGLQKRMLEKVNSLSFEEYASIGTASLLTRQTDDISLLGDVASSLCYYIVNIPLMFIGGGVLAFLSDWTLALLLFAVIPVILLLVYPISKRVGGAWEKSDKMMDKQNAIVRERLKGIRVIRAFDKEGYEHERIASATKTMSRSIVHANVMSGLISPVATFLLNLVTVAVLYVGTVRMQYNALLSAGDVIATVQYVAVMASAVVEMSWMLVWVSQIGVALRRIGEVFALKGGEGENETGKKLASELCFRGVTFSYGGKPALSGVDFTAKKGECIGVIGGTGSGKITLVKLALGFYTDYQGEITLGGENYRDLSAADIRGNISVALQRSMIFEGTAEENIRMSDEGASREAVRTAAQTAMIDPFISSQKEGYGYRFAGQGSNLSGGQKQRVNIARTILKDAGVYIFDDSFSALDFLTESKLRRALNERMKDKTQIIITQRIATAMRCDRVYVLDGGKIVGAGTHAELLASCPIYREIYHSQLGGKEENI